MKHHGNETNKYQNSPSSISCYREIARRCVLSLYRKRILKLP